MESAVTPEVHALDEVSTFSATSGMNMKARDISTMMMEAALRRCGDCAGEISFHRVPALVRGRADVACWNIGGGNGANGAKNKGNSALSPLRHNSILPCPTSISPLEPLYLLGFVGLGDVGTLLERYRKGFTMALFLRGDVWWMEYRTRRVRKVVSTGLNRRDKARAEAAWHAFRLAMGARPKRSAMEGILEAIYGGDARSTGIPLDSAYAVYENWCRMKHRSGSEHTAVKRRNLFARFLAFAKDRGVADVSDVTVSVAGAFIAAQTGKANKTLRMYAAMLSTVWEAVGQMHPGVHNPWKAVCPDDDGSSIRHEAFSDAQIARVLDEAARVGHDWRLACMIALYTGLRYGDVATLEWKDVDLAAGVMTVTPNKTRHSSGVVVTLPIAEPLRPLLADGGSGFVLPEHALRYTAASHPQPMDPPFSSILASCGLSGRQWSFHSWRHTANSRMADAGIPSEIRQMLCGWTNAEMARHYDHAKHLDELSRAVAAIAATSR